MMIKDLDSSKELAREDLSAVRGGSNFGTVGGVLVILMQFTTVAISRSGAGFQAVSSISL